LEKKSLGKGLAALMQMNTVEQKIEAEEIPIMIIDPNPYQPRTIFNDDKLLELAESIKVHGVLQPILIRPKEDGRFEIVAGERRFRASQLIGLTSIPVKIKDMTDTQSLEIALIENIQREDINVVEAAKAYRRLMDEFGHTQEELSKSLGKSRSAIANTLRILNLPNEVLKLLSEKQLSEGHARAILSVSEENRLPFASKIIAENLNVRDAENTAKIINNPVINEPEIIEEKIDVKAHKRIVSRETILTNLKDIKKLFEDALNLKVKVSQKEDKGKITLEYNSKEELERIISLIK